METSRVFVASVGAAVKYDQVTYTLGHESWSTRFAPVAVARLLNLRRASALILVTAKARAKWYDQLAEELAGAGLQPEPVDIPDGRNEDELLAIFRALQERIAQGARVVLDVTFALRHLPFVYLATLAYLVGLRGVEVQGIYYGAYDLKSDGGTVPIINVTSLFQLLEWYHALASARRSGNWIGVVSRLRGDVARLFQRGIGNRQLSRVQTPAGEFAAALGAGLPLEGGIAAWQLCRVLAEIAGQAGDTAPAARLDLEAFRQEAAAWQVAGEPKEKKDIALGRAELDRQLRLAKSYADNGDLPKSLSVLREWMLNAMIMASGDTNGWLDYGARRKPTEQTLNALDYRAQSGVASGTDSHLASVWRKVADRRNQLQHAGMRPEPVRVSVEHLRALLDDCERALPDILQPSPTRASNGRLLVSPLGLSPGVLYSALSHLTPDRLVIVTSREASARLEEALARAENAHIERLTRALQDPHQGFLEVNPAADTGLRTWLAGAREVMVNMTGGTTAMQHAVERIAEEARRLGASVRRCALIDRRTPEEQRADPYVLGELLWLDEDPAAPSHADGAGEA